MRKFIHLVVAVCILTFSASSQTASKVEKKEKCESERFINFCSMIGSRTPDITPNTPFKYLYQRRLHDVAGVIGEKDEAVIAKKISKVWSECEEELVCEAFDTPGASIIKYAVSNNFDLFLEDITEWGVNLNRVDKVDDRTPLDYIKYWRDRNKGNPLESKMRFYYDLLRESGAKHKSEL